MEVLNIFEKSDRSSLKPNQTPMNVVFHPSDLSNFFQKIRRAIAIHTIVALNHCKFHASPKVFSRQLKTLTDG
jgi:hypothetical protein